MSNVPDERERDIAWSDSHSTDSESGSSPMASQPSAWTTSVTTARMNAGQLSPISTEFDIPGHDRVTGGVLPPMIHSATSSSADSWSTSWSEDMEVEDAGQEAHWDHGLEGALAVPKIEPLEDESFSMENIKEAPQIGEMEQENDVSIPPKVKRPRGRPRKHPIAQPVATSKVAKGRSKTGCQSRLPTMHRPFHAAASPQYIAYPDVKTCLPSQASIGASQSSLYLIHPLTRM